MDGGCLASVMRAFGGMVDFSLSRAYSPMMSASDGFRVVVMPVMSQRASEQQKADREAKEASEPEAEAESEPTEAQLDPSEAEAQAKGKRKRSPKKEPVPVA